MKTLLNIIWFLFAGVWLWFLYVFAGILCCLTIIGIPFGIASFRMARYVVWPFGKAVVPAPRAGTGSQIANVIWFVVAGWWLALAHVAAAIAQTLTVVGILNAVVSLKMIPVSCFPFGKRIVDRSQLVGQVPLHSV